ncbi:SPFH domain-containing protein [Luteococcus japonicus]|uniref:Phage protein n=1 Tax=Luteococcus japonicus LSP_Lj1 TaxID=1255658 RepID=A0A1R4K1H9_9ACTN|nr:SPFH domain-containing protein [Luteococcus japonicus]SJN37925.1 Phage protein [Luteococcus japonicus LSP_Lj1]
MFLLATALIVVGMIALFSARGLSSTPTVIQPGKGKGGRTTTGPAPRGAARTLGAVALAGGVLALAASCATLVPTQQVGIRVAFGRPVGTLQNGLHVKAPWERVVKMDGTVQIDDNLGENRTEIRLGNQSVAYVQNAVRWRIKSDAADRLYRDHKTFERIGPALQEQELSAALNEAFKDYNPLATATGDAKSLDEVAVQVKQRLEKKIGDRLVIDSVIIPKVDFDPQTQSRIDAYQTEVGNTRIAEQRKKTAAAEAAANKELAASVSKDPNVLVSKCMDQMTEMVQKGQQIPVGFSCWPASSGTGGVIVNSTPTTTTAPKK